MNEMSTAECAERLENIIDYAGDTLDDALEFNLRNTLNYASAVMSKVAAGELVEVVHGEWLNFVGDFSTAECNRCGEVYEVSPDEKPCENYFNAFKQFYKYCPSCGALMDGKDDNNAEIH